MRGRAGPALAVAALLAGWSLAGCGSSGGDDDPIAPAEGAVDPSRVLENAQYPEIGLDGLQRTVVLHAGHTTVVLSYVPGLSVDVEAAEAALSHFETLQQQVDLPVGDGGPALAYAVRPRNIANRYVVVVPEVCTAESRQLAARSLGIAADRYGALVGAAPATATVRGGALLGPPPFDPARYDRLPRIGPIFALGG